MVLKLYNQTHDYWSDLIYCQMVSTFTKMYANKGNNKPTGTRIPDPPLFPHLVPPAIMIWIFVWKYIFEPFIHILQHFVLQLSRSTNFWTGKNEAIVLTSLYIVKNN